MPPRTAAQCWRLLPTIIAEFGLVDAHGKDPTRDTAFRTWRRVLGDVAAARALKQGRPVVAIAPGEIVPGVRALPAYPANARTTANDFLAPTHPRTLLEIRPARPLSGVPDSPTAKRSVAGTNPASFAGSKSSEHATQQIQRVLDSIGAARVPMPKTIP
jgi:hypothetical protein